MPRPISTHSIRLRGNVTKHQFLLELVAILVGNGIAPVLAQPARRDAYADRRLAALVFADTQQLNYPLDVLAVMTLGLDLAQAEVMLDVGLHDRVKHIVGRQAVL